MTKYQVDKKIPIPVHQNSPFSRASKWAYTDDMEIGDSTTVSNRNESHNIFIRMQVRDRKCTTRTLKDGRVRVWRIS